MSKNLLLETKLCTDISLEEISALLSSFPKDSIQPALNQLFFKYIEYKKLTEWNKLVRICEALTILGWGDLEPMEAIKTLWFNGNPYTCLLDKNSDERFRSAIWSKRKTGHTMEPGRTYKFVKKPNLKCETLNEEIQIIIQPGKFLSQRNWIFRNPVRPRIGLGNVDEKLKYVQQLVPELRNHLNEKLNSERYGKTLNFISIAFFFSCEYTGYVIIPQGEKQSQIGHKTLKTPKFRLKRFSKKNGIFSVDYYFPKEFGDYDEQSQRKKFKTEILEIVNACCEKLKPKCKNYDFEKMRFELISALNQF